MGETGDQLSFAYLDYAAKKKLTKRACSWPRWQRQCHGQHWNR